MKRKQNLQPSQTLAALDIKLINHGQGIFSIQLPSAEGNRLSAALIKPLIDSLDALQQNPSLKVLILKGQPDCFLSGDQAEHHAAIVQGLYSRISAFAYPTIAVLQGHASGAGFLLAALCDFMVISQTGDYHYTSSQAALFPSAAEEQLFIERFGQVQASNFLYYNPSGLSGQQLQEKGCSCPILPAEEVEAYAHKLAANLVNKSQHSLRLLKQHLNRYLLKQVQNLSVETVSESAKQTEQPTVKLNSTNHLHLTSHTNGVLQIHFERLSAGDFAANSIRVDSLVKDLRGMFAELDNSTYRILVLSSEYPGFLPDNLLTVDAVLDCQQLLLDAPIPVISVLDQGVTGLAWLISQSSDACIYSEQAQYSGAGLLQIDALAKVATRLFIHRLGDLGKDILFTGADYAGLELQQRLGSLLIEPQAQVLSTALSLAESWAAFPQATLRAWKQQLRQRLQASLSSGPDWSVATGTTSIDNLPATPTPVELHSTVISATVHPEGVLVVKMQDEQAKNLFSDAILQGMDELLIHINTNTSYKAVVLSGYDQYFASGGTKDNLLAIQAGKAKFTDSNVYQMALDCPLPVIAAMQGHGVGGGLSMGLFADFIIFSEESKYLSPYMSYGFTPGAGATFIVPSRLGYDLGRETLLTSQDYSGSELQARNLSLPVLPRDKVLEAALALARQLAGQSRACLIAAKQQLTYNASASLKATYALELAMHEQTFVGQAQTLVQIHSEFIESAEQLAEETNEVQQNTVRVSSSAQQPDVSTQNHDSLPDIIASLKKLLAAELHMPVDEIDEQAQFFDLGLDSITGVTWMRKINAEYNTSIDAIKVYSYTNLLQLGAYLQQQISQQDLSVERSPKAAELTDPLPAIISTLKKLLAVELHMPVDEIDEQAQLVDLGLDSITGMTWMSKINAEYNTSIDDINVYSYTNLLQLGAYLQQQISQQDRSVERSPKAAKLTDPLPAIISTLKKLLAAELHMPVDEIDEQAQFVDLGLDSITGVTWMRKINAEYNTSIDAIKVYSYTTLSTLGRYVEEQIKPLDVSFSAFEQASASVATQTTNLLSLQDNTAGFILKKRQKLASQRHNKQLSKTTNTPPAIAVIGMAGQFPQANNIDDYWQNIAKGKNCISEIPQSRWDIDLYYQQGQAVTGKTNCRYMGCLEEYDLFDPLFFNISPKEAISMDPQQRLLLQTCWQTIEHAGYNPKALAGSQCGVFIGCGPSDYHLLSRDLQISALGFTGGDTAILAARISYFFDLRGPCLSIETACSSSLVALANACDSLASADSDLALAGGVGVIVGPDLHIKTSQTGMLSPDGRCFTFDNKANGFVPGEGVGAVMLKRLSDAEKDQDTIIGVIQGWGVNQDGLTNGITAPNPESQTRLQQSVYDKYHIDPAAIQLIEAHGTGTNLGDPIEVDALKQSFKRYTQQTQYCALGSVKSNIGHCFTAAGIASIIKVLLALKHKKLPPTINFERLNKHIELTNSPFYINNHLQDWQVQGTQKRQAAINGFGFGGTNAHIVIAEYTGKWHSEPDYQAIPINQPKLIVLSAKKATCLKSMANNLKDYLSRPAIQATHCLQDIAYTLQVGREAMEYRLGIIVSSIEQLLEKLKAYIDNEENIDDLYSGQVTDNKQSMSILSQDEEIKEAIIERWLEQNKLSKILGLWVKGVNLDWSSLLYPDHYQPKHIDLPVYPFDKQRYWVDTTTPLTNMATAVLHPLLHKNTSDFMRQSYSLTLNGEEFFLKDHQFAGQKILQPLIYLEIARVAVAQASASQQSPNGDASAITLANIVWAQPVVLAENNSITIALFAIDNNRIDFEISSDNTHQEIVHCQGQLLIGPAFSPAKIDIDQLNKQLGQHRLDASDVYSNFNKMNIQYGPANQGITVVKQGAEQLLVEFSLPEIVKTSQTDYILHPSLLDSIFQSCMTLLTGCSAFTQQPALPYSLQNLHILSTCPEQVLLWVRYSTTDQSLHNNATQLDIDICDRQGNICVHIQGISLNQVTSHTLQSANIASDSTADKLISLETLQQQLIISLAEALYLQTSDINVDKTFVELGLDSIVGVEWVNELNKTYKLAITATKIYDYPNLKELALFLREELEKAAPCSDKTPDTSANIATSKPPAKVTKAPIAAEQLQKQLINSLADALYLRPSDITVDKNFVELGLDSIVGVEWVSQLNKQYNLNMTATRIYDYSNIQELALFLSEALQELSIPIDDLSEQPEESLAPLNAELAATIAYPVLEKKQYAHATGFARHNDTSATDKIAVIGMSGRYPQANNLQQYWQNLLAGKNAITEVPLSRWNVAQYYDSEPGKEGKLYCKWLGMLDDVEFFDPLFFKISPAEAVYMDPQHRLFLQEAYKAFEDAGYSNSSLSNQKCGVYLGIIGNEYASLIAKNHVSSTDITGNNYAIAAARIAYFLNLKGPAISLDTACSSSLVAIHLACQGLLNHEIDMALAGGVSTYLTAEGYIGMCQAGMLSPTGQCKTFDDSADGFVPGEGVGAVVLKRLRQAEQDNDCIHGVILGSGINQDGKTNGITAPSVNSQIELERELYAKYHIDPETISYVETHGTGTRLGDPIELEALATVFKEKTPKRNYCALGSVKSNLGHTSGAAGVASLQKVLLSMQHKTLVPSLNVSKENTLFDFKDSPFYISKEKQTWHVSPNTLRRASVSSFGFSGTNAHAIIEEYRPAVANKPVAIDTEPYTIVLSARTPDQLQQRVLDLLNFIRLQHQPQSIDLKNMAFTLLMGRDAMDERLAMLVNSIDQLINKLQAYVNSTKNIQDFFEGKVKRNQEGTLLIHQDKSIAETVDRCIADRQLLKLLELWVQGLELDWDKLYGKQSQPKRMSLPTYPFAKKRYWLNSIATEQQFPILTSQHVIHPLLHNNISRFDYVGYNTTLSGEEFFLLEQKLQATDRSRQKIFPAVAYLEMACAAIQNIMANSEVLAGFELYNIVWGQPMVVAQATQINIALRKRNKQQIDFEIYSQSHAKEIVHCQGKSVFSDSNNQTTLDIEQLKRQMTLGSLDMDNLYQIVNRIGLDDSSTYQSITAIYQGEKQLLAQLQLPDRLVSSQHQYWLHPNILNSALQSALGLFGDLSRQPQHLSLPFALESVHIFSACTQQMFVWLRYGESATDDHIIKLDIDLCDPQGQVCIQLHGVSYEQSTANAITQAPEPVQASRPAVANQSIASSVNALDSLDKPQISIGTATFMSPSKASASLSKASISLSDVTKKPYDQENE